MPVDVTLKLNGQIISDKDQKREKRLKGKSLINIPDSYVVIDIETTGLCSYYDEIIELSAIKIIDNQIVDKFSSLVKPENEIDDFITQLTGITNDMVKDAPKIEDILLKFSEFIGNEIIVGHNVNFDINFIYDDLKGFHHIIFDNDFVDTMRLSKSLLLNLDNHKLKTVAKHFEIKFDKMHRGLIDCEIANSVLTNLKNDIITKFGSFEKFKIEHHKKVELKAKNITTDIENFDTESAFYRRVCVFTGELSKMSRRQAMQCIADRGGKCEDDLTQRANLLIIGTQDYSRLNGKTKSSKMIKAEKYILKGQDLMILSESVFYDLLDT